MEFEQTLKVLVISIFVGSVTHAEEPSTISLKLASPEVVTVGVGPASTSTKNSAWATSAEDEEYQYPSDITQPWVIDSGEDPDPTTGQCVMQRSNGCVRQYEKKHNGRCHLVEEECYSSSTLGNLVTGNIFDEQGRDQSTVPMTASYARYSYHEVESRVGRPQVRNGRVTIVPRSNVVKKLVLLKTKGATRVESGTEPRFGLFSFCGVTRSYVADSFESQACPSAPTLQERINRLQDHSDIANSDSYAMDARIEEVEYSAYRGDYVGPASIFDACVNRPLREVTNVRRFVPISERACR